MDSEFPDFDDDFDLVHEDEYEVLREIEAAESQKSAPKNASQSQNNNKTQPCSNNKQNDTSLSQHKDKDPQTEVQNNISLSQNKDKNSQIEINFLTDKETVFSQCNGTSNKRSIDQITDDISSNFFNPLDYTDLDKFQSPEKKRPCWDQPEEIIKLILERRKRNNNSNILKNGDDNIETILRDETKYISRRVPTWNFVAITRCEDGERFYIKVSDKTKYKPEKTKTTSNSLILSFSQLKDEAEKILQKQIEKASIEVVESSDNKSSNCELWVDKYRPKRYLDLLSDENVNRTLLCWLKLWDKIVFDRDPTVGKRKPLVTSKKNGFKKQEDIPEYDSKGFPTQRIALLSGPPGLGKTTLAHVAARHAGYNIVELNASDDRGPEAFREALLASTQMRAVIDKEKRPNCLVLDEIDGAPAASIELLLKFIHGKLAPKGKNAKIKEKNSDGCRRPIICICNDLYAPSLRPLRSMALVISVPEITPLSLAERLAQITRKEGLRVDMRLLIQLAEKSACDVRACLGILQYTGGGVNMLQNISLGLKDMRKGLFDSWREMLQVPINNKGALPVTERVQRTMKITHQVETERLCQGVFHNYPTICKDKVDLVSDSLEWFEFYDVINNLVMEQQSWILMPYTSTAAVAWHLYLAVTQTPKLTYPTTLFEVNKTLERNKAILMLTKKTCKMDVMTLVTDVLPFLPDLLSPRLRSVNAQLYSLKEKQELERLVNLMLDFGLTFTQERRPEGGYEYKLDPNLWDLGCFPECKPRKQLAYAVKQIVIQELETTRLQRAALAHGELNNTSATSKTGKKDSSTNLESGQSTAKDSQNVVPNHLRQQLNPLNVRPDADKKCRNFFRAFQLVGQEKYKQKLEKDKADGIINEKDLEKIENDKANEKRKNALKNNVYYEYKEGYNNAVRRTVLMKSLL